MKYDDHKLGLNISAGETTLIMTQNDSTCLSYNVESILQHVFSEPTTSEEEDAFAWVVEGVLILVAFLVGLLGNSFSIVIFSRQKVHRIFHHLLLLLAIFDMVSSILTLDINFCKRKIVNINKYFEYEILLIL